MNGIRDPMGDGMGYAMGDGISMGSGCHLDTIPGTAAGPNLAHSQAHASEVRTLQRTTESVGLSIPKPPQGPVYAEPLSSAHLQSDSGGAQVAKAEVQRPNLAPGIAHTRASRFTSGTRGQRVTIYTRSGTTALQVRFRHPRTRRVVRRSLGHSDLDRAKVEVTDLAQRLKIRFGSEWVSDEADGTCQIYVVLRPDTSELKIGRARNVKRRLDHLQTAHGRPLQLLLAFPANEAFERELHRRFAVHRLLGEWFRADAELLEWVERAKQELASDRPFVWPA